MTARDVIDARALDPGTVLDAEVCVVGAGAAGIVLALRLAAAGHRTLLLEAGGLDEDAWTTDLFAGPNLGLPYFPLGESRAHRFGGTTYRYGGHSKPVGPRDFDPVPGLPLATWPICYRDLAPWVDDALVLLGHRPSDFDLATRLREAALGAPEVHDDIAVTHLFVRDAAAEKPYPVRFANELRATRNLRIALHAVVTRVALDPAGHRVTHLDVGSERGATIRVDARHFVMACHAVENARLLLDSDDVLRQGIGNGSGLLGRCFMDHPHVDAGRVRFERGVPAHLVYPAMSRYGFAACISAPQAITDAAECLQYFCRLLPVEHNRAGADAVRVLGRAWRHPRGRTFRRALGRAGRDPWPALLALSRTAGFHPREFVLNHRIEQAPNPESRIVLVDERDALGRRRAGVDWRLSATDARTLEVGQAAALRYLERVGATRIRPARADEGSLATHGATYWHHIGTTRMSESPDDGVVDRDCRVHGVVNLSVAGSSVFCRATFSPPTMTIVAFSLRLADHLHRQLSSR